MSIILFVTWVKGSGRIVSLCGYVYKFFFFGQRAKTQKVSCESVVNFMEGMRRDAGLTFKCKVTKSHMGYPGIIKLIPCHYKVFMVG